jgi:hypothetical protein
MSRVGDAYIEVQELAVQAIENGAQTVNDVLTYVNTHALLKVDEPFIVQIIQDLDYDYGGSASYLMENN